MKLETDGVEKLEQHFVEKFNLKDEKGKRWNQFRYIERRVGCVIAMKRDEFFKIPHYLVPDHKQKGDYIHGICTQCYTELFFDEEIKEHYCPRCE